MSAETALSVGEVQTGDWPPGRMTDLLIDGAQRFPAWWVADSGERASFGELADRAGRLAGGLVDWGVRPGDHIAVLMDNSVGWLDLWFATAWVGGVLVPVNTRFSHDEAAYVISASDSRWLVTEDPGFGRQRLRDAYDINLRGVATAGAASAPNGAALGQLASSAWVESREPTGHVGMIQYTSGSTAFPKGAMLQSGSLIRNGDGLGRAWKLTTSDRILSANPLFHCGGSVFAFLAAAVSGSAIRLMRRWDLDNAADLIEQERITVVPGIDAMVRDLVAYAKATGQPFPSLRLVSTAADRELFEAVVKYLSVDISNVYGLTECSPNVCVGDLDDPEETRLAHIGRPQSGLAVDIRHPDTGQSMSTGHVGEIVVRGWAVMDAYYNDPTSTASATTTDGYLRTGDLGGLNQDGYLTFAGRLKGIIKSGGENIATAEVEETLRRHPNVADVAVVPVPDPRFGEVGYAYVARVPGRELDSAELTRLGRQYLAGFKIPKFVTVVDDLPRTGSGKVDRQALRESAERQVANGEDSP